MELRNYQSWFRHNILQALKENDSVVAVLPTGGGKRYSIVDLCLLAMQHNRRVLVATNRRLLVDQMVKECREHGVHYGVIMADYMDGDPGGPIQIASIQTLESWYLKPKYGAEPGIGLPEWSLLLIDEGHSDVARYEQLRAIRPHAKVIAFTATPVGTEGRSLTPSPYSVMVEGATNSELIARGYLLPTKVYAPSEPNIEGVKLVKSGEYNQNQLGRAVTECTVFADVYAEWERHAGTRSTVAFVPGIPFGRDLVRQFNFLLGAGSAHLIEAKTKHHEREEAFRTIKEGRSKILVSCNVLCLDSQTEILTSRGFVGIDEFSADDLAANWHMPEHWSHRPKITFEKPIKVFRRPRIEGEWMAVLKTKRNSVRVTKDHTVVWRSAPNGYYRPSSALSMEGKHFDIPVCGVATPLHVEIEQPLKVSKRTMAGLVTKTAYNLRQNGMPSPEARQEAEKRIARKYSLRRKNPHEVSLDECRFIGFWIGDGRKAPLIKFGLEYYVTSSLVYPNIIKWFDGVCERMGYDYKRNTKHKHESPHVKWAFARGTGGGHQARNGIFPIEHFLDKHLDALLWTFSEEQFDAFLEGFWYAEGDHGKADKKPGRKGWRVSNADYELLCTIQSVACCRGWRTSLRPESRVNRPDHHRRVWKLGLSKMQDASIGLGGENSITIEKDHSNEEVWCIKSTSGFIVTRRGGVVTVLGNCEGFDLPALSCAVDLQPNSQLRSYWQKLGRIKRPYGSQQDALYLDFAGNYWKFPHPNQDPIWPQGEETTQEAIKAARKAGDSSQPIMCPKCSMVRERGPVCPGCGYKAEGAIRRIRMGKGKLKEISAYQKEKREKTESEKLFSKWQSRLFGALKSGLTYSQAAHLFKKETGEPPRAGWPGVYSPLSSQWNERPRDHHTTRSLAIECRRCPK